MQRQASAADSALTAPMCSAAARAARDRSAIRHLAARVWDATANPDGPGLLLRGCEYEPVPGQELHPFVVGALVRLARLSGEVADALRDCPDPAVRRSAAILAARAHPLRVGLDD
jgi:hypothetical protein